MSRDEAVSLEAQWQDFGEHHLVCFFDMCEYCWLFFS